MIGIPGDLGKDLCDAHLPMSRRDVLRVGGSSMLGLTLGSMLQLKAETKTAHVGGPGWGKAKSVIMIYLQGGPSHLDLWDPKPDAPDNVRSIFKPIPTKIPGVNFTELMPKLAQVNDKFTMMRAVSYTPKGLFNHTAAIYQMMTGYTTDKVSPSGQLEPPSPKDFPNFGSNIIRFKPPTEPMLPFVMLPRPLQESGVVGKGGTAGFLGKAYDPYTLYPPGGDMDMNKMDKIRVDDLEMRPDMFGVRLHRRARLRNAINDAMPVIDKAVSQYKLNEHYDRALSLVASGRAREAFAIGQETESTREMYGRNTFGQSCLLARRLVEAGTRVVEVIWPKVANSDNHSWDHHRRSHNYQLFHYHPIYYYNPLRNHFRDHYRKPGNYPKLHPPPEHHYSLEYNHLQDHYHNHHIRPKLHLRPKFHRSLVHSHLQDHYRKHHIRPKPNLRPKFLCSPQRKVLFQ